MYGKVFESIFRGSLYGNYEALVTFQAMIVLADEDGIIDISPQALAATTSYPPEVINKGLKVLQQSDPHSRSPDENGKRIVLLDEDREFGWRIVNYEYYRNLGKRADTREKARERQRRKRKKDAQATDSEPCNAAVTLASRQSAIQIQIQDTIKSAHFAQFWEAYPRKKNKKRARETWERRGLDSLADKILADLEVRPSNDPAWKDIQFIPYPTTYLNGERWNDELDVVVHKPRKPEVITDEQRQRDREKADRELEALCAK